MKHIFLYGLPQIGKSTLLLETLSAQNVLVYALGYKTLRIINTNGEIIGYAHTLPNESPKVNRYSNLTQPQQFLFFEAGKMVKFDIHVFYQFTYSQLKNALSDIPHLKRQHFILMDEFAGMELSDRQVREIIIAVLQSDIPCIGIMKAPQYIKNLSRQFTLKEDGDNSFEQLLNLLEDREKTMLINVGKEKKETIEKMIQTWLHNNRIGEKIEIR